MCIGRTKVVFTEVATWESPVWSVILSSNFLNLLQRFQLIEPKVAIFVWRERRLR